jgi:hypothetical protein
MVADVLQTAAALGLPSAVKIHPRCRSYAFKQFVASTAARCGASLLDQFNIHDVLSAARCIATVNSGAGFEALLHLKTVLSFGASDYQAATRQIMRVDQIGEALTDDAVVTQKTIKAFLYGYLRRRQVSIYDAEFDDKIITLIRRKIATGTLGYLCN